MRRYPITKKDTVVLARLFVCARCETPIGGTDQEVAWADHERNRWLCDYHHRWPFRRRVDN